MKELTINCLCRVCLRNSHLHTNIYEGNSLDEFLVYELVNDVCDLGISVDDGLPEFLCAECFAKIIEFKTFKTNAHKGRSTFLLLKERVEYPIIKQEEVEISGDESEELVDGTYTEPIFGPILLKNEMLTVYSDRQHQEEVIKSKVFVSVDAVEPPDTYMEDSMQEVDHDGNGLNLCDEAAIRELSSDDDMGPLTLESEDKDMESTEVKLTSLETVTHPKSLQCLDYTRHRCTSDGEICGDSCACSNSINDKSKNTSLSDDVVASSSGTVERLEGQMNLPGESAYLDPFFQQDISIREEVKIYWRTEEDIKKGEGWRGTGTEKRAKKRREGLECFHCGIVVWSKLRLRKHMKVHGFVNSYDCGVCGKVFDFNSKLNRHILTHAGSKPYICAECNKCFNQISHLKRHISLHMGYKPYKCAECSKCFSQNAHLKIHMRTHTGCKPYKCAECCKCFSDSSNLKKHMKRHTVSKRHKCTECSKCFSKNSNLKKHMTIHTGSKPHKCTECSKCFSGDSSLKIHMRIHTGYKPYKCAECSKCFTRNYNLKTHMRTHTCSKPCKSR